MVDSKTSEILAARIEAAKSNLELAKVESLIKAEELQNTTRHQFYTLTIPILLAAASLSVGAVSLYFENLGETNRQDSAQSLTQLRDEMARRHDHDMRVGALVDEYLKKDPKTEASSHVLCVHWQTSDLSEATFNQLQAVITSEKLCGTSGGGFANLAVMPTTNGVPDPDAALKQLCISSPWIEIEAVAYDKSGFNSRPNGEAPIKLDAPTDHFLGPPETTTVVNRRAKGTPIIDQFLSSATKRDFAGKELTVAYSGKIFCTNDRGTGRTCEHRVRARAKTFPQDCAKFF